MCQQWGVTFISISQNVSAGSTVIFTGNTCQIYDKERRVIGTIQRYQVNYTHPLKGEYAGKTKVEVSIDEFHCRLGHVSHERAQMLVTKEVIEGVELDMMSKPSVCESCK
jgi:hypothetical protein